MTDLRGLVLYIFSQQRRYQDIMFSFYSFGTGMIIIVVIRDLQVISNNGPFSFALDLYVFLKKFFVCHPSHCSSRFMARKILTWGKMDSSQKNFPKFKV